MHLVNQTMLHLCKRIILKHKHINPIRSWEEGSWLYHCTQPTPGKNLCNMVAPVEYNSEICTMRHTNGLQWPALPSAQQDNISHCLRHQSQAWHLENNHLLTFLGLTTPSLPKGQNQFYLISSENKEQVGESDTPETDKPDG